MKTIDFVKDENNFERVSYRVVNGLDITNAVKEICEIESYPYSDSLRRLFSKELEKQGITDNKKDVVLENTDEYQEALNRTVPSTNYYIISSAQTETEVHKQFFENIKAFAEHIDGEIIIQPSRYKNPTSLESNKRVKDKEANNSVWSPELRPFLLARRLELNTRVTALMDLKVQPTAKTPLSGLNGFTGDSTAILPHPKIQLDSMPVLPSQPKKLLLTTGSVTVPNYTDTKIGAQSLFEHEYGFILVEIVDDAKFFVHQVVADDSGTFYFLDYKVKNGKVTQNSEPYPAIVLGDLHVGEIDKEALRASVLIENRLKSQNTFLHDVADMSCINHHELKKPFTLLYKEEENKLDLLGEIEAIIEELNVLNLRLFGQMHIVESNHPLWIEKWLEESDWRKTPNKKAYLMLANVLAEKQNQGKSILNYIIEQRIPSIKTYTENDSLKICGYEMLIHGHLGASGSRGGIGQFKNLNTKGISAHTHSPKRSAGWLVAGTLTTLNPEYTKGLSSWLHSNVVITPNGKATHIHTFNGEYSTL